MSVSIANTTAQLAGKALAILDATLSITGLWTFNRGVSAPFAVAAGAAAVANLDADKLDGQEGTYYTNMGNAAAGTLAVARGGTGAATTDANKVFAGPSSGSAAAPSFRVLAGADLTSAAATRVLDRDVTVNDVNTTTTETTVFTSTIAAGTLSTNKGVRLTLIGDYLNNSGGNSNLTVRVKYGTTTIASATHTMGASANRGAQFVESVMFACNNASAQRAFTRWYSAEGSENNNAGTLTVSSGTNRDHMGAHNAIAENSAGALAFAVTVEHSVSNANISFRCHSVILELLE